MPAVPVLGNVSTEEVESDPTAVPLDFDERFKRLKPDDTQFMTMMSRLPRRVAIREKVNWVEEDLFPRMVTLNTAAATGITSLVLNAGHGKIVQPNDILRNMRTNEAIRVTAVSTDTLTVARKVGSAAEAAMNVGDVFLVVADAQPQGADFPVPRYMQRVLGFNYTQIVRTPWAFTNTAIAVEWYGGREPAREGVRKAVEDKRKWEHLAFFGARSFAAAVPPENEPQGTAGGLVEFIQTNTLDAAGPLTPAAFDALLSAAFQYGGTNKVLFAAPLLVQNMSVWNRTGMGSQWAPNPDNVHGVKVDAFISGAYGYRVPVVVKKEWGEFPIANKGYGTYGFLVDMDYVEFRPLRDRASKLLTDRQPKGKDTYAQEYLQEATFEISNEKAHALIKGVTAPV